MSTVLALWMTALYGTVSGIRAGVFFPVLQFQNEPSVRHWLDTRGTMTFASLPHSVMPDLAMFI